MCLEITTLVDSFHIILYLSRLVVINWWVVTHSRLRSKSCVGEGFFTSGIHCFCFTPKSLLFGRVI
jgi:hypothetical protein